MKTGKCFGKINEISWGKKDARTGRDPSLQSTFILINKNGTKRGHSLSVSSINQYISAYKLLQVDVLGREWEPVRIKRPRRVKKLPVVLSVGEVERLIGVTLRHCFATHLLEMGVNLRLIQQFMGHVSLKTTAGYLHLVTVNPASVVSPLDSMNV